MTPYWRAFAGLGLPWALAAALIVTLASCSSGSNVPSTAPSPTDAGPVVVLPATANVFAEVPTTFTVVGGSGHYLLASSDASVIPVPTTLAAPSLTVIPNNVSANTTVTLTVRDANGTTQATVQVVVKPRTVANSISVIPSAGQSASCGAAVCAGGDAEVVATLTQAGAPLVGRDARFDVLSGDFRFITPGASAETLTTSAIVTTDSSGKASVRIRVLASASAQTALVQITDVTSGSFQRASFAIAPGGGSALAVQPAAIGFTGVDATECASHVSAEVIVTGGTPPYAITQPAGFSVSPTTIVSSGGRFVVSAFGQCSSGTQIGVVDAVGTGRTIAVTNVLGPVTVAPLAVGPSVLTLDVTCASTRSAIIAGGVGPPYFAVSGDSYLSVSIASDVTGSGTVSVSRTVKTPPGPAPPPGVTAIPVAITDGREVRTISVDVSSGSCQ